MVHNFYASLFNDKKVSKLKLKVETLFKVGFATISLTVFQLGVNYKAAGSKVKGPGACIIKLIYGFP